MDCNKFQEFVVIGYKFTKKLLLFNAKQLKSYISEFKKEFIEISIKVDKES
uniref:Uncharacterized protein n=1 Tax=Florenciella sp. virus SA2 TaxID=3240092 RepID=A0AB39JD81_9VIRU